MFGLDIQLPGLSEEVKRATWMNGCLWGFVLGSILWIVVGLVLNMGAAMNRNRIVALTAIALGLLWALAQAEANPKTSPLAPASPAKPWRPFGDAEKLQTGGNVSPADGKTEVQVDLPVDQRAKNVGGRDGAGLCVFTSIMHSARYQNERRLFDFQQCMRAEPGGGYPQKVDSMIGKYAKGTPYLQYEGGDPAVLKAALKTGRMPAITYCGRDMHYGGQSVAHMVNLVYLDDSQAAVMDNNFIQETDLVWMSTAEFLERWKGNGGGWAVILLANPPSPVPHN